jgi:type III restriction enzyme
MFMSNAFFDHPILNSPYERPARHWELDESGQPTQRIIETRRRADFVTPIPKPKKRKKSNAAQETLEFAEGKELSTKDQKYDLTGTINQVRGLVADWRALTNPSHWQVTPETARLLQHWRHHKFNLQRPFFCQIEAVETAIWLTEVAPGTRSGKLLTEYLASASRDGNGDLQRLALKLATGAGKTTVMAMLIAWQTANAVRRPGSGHFSKGFLVCTPGLTIKDRLRVLQPNDPDNYYVNRELVPPDMLDDLKKARIVITNYHAFKLRERVELSAGGRALLTGRTGDALQTEETEGQMLQRVMPELMGMKNILAINDEAHHCYREKPRQSDDEDFKGDERKEAEKNNEAARLWISGLEIVNRKLGLSRVMDLSATPFFLRGSGYAEGTLFQWTMSDFSLMDAIECGIVKLPRVPVAENIPGEEMPMFRDLWENLKEAKPRLPMAGRKLAGELDPLKLPTLLQTALQALYGHYEKTFKLWEAKKLKVPPCFIIVCQNTAISKLVYDYISGFQVNREDGSTDLVNGRLRLFQNFDESTGNPLPRPNTLLIDSEQLEAGDALDDNFRTMAADEIERFRREIVERTGDPRAGENLSDQELLREVMNTVGKPDQLGGSVRCVVSVSMLTEGWDANTVTHVLGIRAFGTQLLCEQVIGRALRRQSYELNEEGLFDVEYADVFGIPFDFTAKPVPAPPRPPVETVMVRAVRPERDALEIQFPNVEGYRVELPDERLTAAFNDDSVLELTPELVGPSITRNAGIIGEGADMNLEHLDDVRPSSVVFELTKHLLYNKWRDPGEEPRLHLFGQLKRIARQWLDACLVCKGGTYPGLLMYQELADMAANKITAAINRQFLGERPIKALLDSYNPTGSTRFVRFPTSREHRWDTGGPPPKNHVNWVILDSDWEAEFCRAAEANPRVLAYTKNHNLQFEVPYRYGSETRRYRPDFIVLVDDGRGASDPLHLVVEIKGYRREDAKEKKSTMETYWVPGVNHLGSHGRWAFSELTEMYQIEADFKVKIESAFSAMLDAVSASHSVSAVRDQAADMIRRHFGSGPQLARLNMLIWDSIDSNPERGFRLSDLRDLGATETESALAILSLLSDPSIRLVELQLRAEGGSGARVTQQQLTKRITDWWRKKEQGDEAWRQWAEDVAVSWVRFRP